MIAEELAKLFPHGHPAFIPMCVAEIELYSAKSYEYTDGGDPMGNFKRVAGMLAPYTEVTPTGVALVYMSKQLDAAMWMRGWRMWGCMRSWLGYCTRRWNCE